MVPTWHNRWTWIDRVVKRLDKFLVAEDLLDSMVMLRKWVDYGGKSYHSLIVLEIIGSRNKHPNPFKFNVKWLKYPSYMSMVQDSWVHIP